jgi:hypothetical protein
MTDSELRLECLRLAIVTSEDVGDERAFISPADVLTWARNFYEFVSAGNSRGFDA